jgi:hypothetical protein
VLEEIVCPICRHPRTVHRQEGPAAGVQPSLSFRVPGGIGQLVSGAIGVLMGWIRYHLLVRHAGSRRRTTPLLEAP